jgi:hypothetical protein
VENGHIDNHGGEQMENESDYGEEQAQINREIIEECQEYGENMHRSDEEGWFYPDDESELE